MRTKNLLSIFLSIAILLSLFAVPVSAETAPTDAWSAYAANAFAGGTGTEADPYLIATEGQLAKLSVDVANGTEYKGEWFKLTNDLDLSAHRWNPIGQYRHKDNGTTYGDFTYKAFYGNFDGNGKTIRGIYVDEATDGFSGGLFGCIDAGNNALTIRDLTIKDAEIYGKEEGLRQGYSGILGSYVSANIDKKILIENVSVSGSLNITCIYGNYSVGGMFGYANNITFTDCAVDNIYQYAATNSGGFVGMDDNCTYTDCSARGTVYGSWAMGGFVGYTTLQNYEDSSTHSTFTRCVADVDVIANDWNVGGFCGLSIGGVFTSCAALGDVYSQVTAFEPRTAGFLGNMESYYDYYNDTPTLGPYPTIMQNCYFGGAITSDHLTIQPSGLVAVGATDGTITNCAYDGDKNSGIVGYASETSSTALPTSELSTAICLNVLGGHTMQDKTCTTCGYIEKEALYVSFFTNLEWKEQTADWTPNLTAFDTTTGVHFNTKGLNSRDTEINGDYNVQWYDKSDNILDKAPTDAGSYTIKITLGETAGASYTLAQDTLTYTINPLNLSTANIGLEWPGKQPTYNGKQQLPSAPDAAVKNSSYTLPEGSYTFMPVEGKNCTNAGQAFCLIVGDGKNVVGQIEKSYYINSASYDLPEATKRTYTYDGTPKATDFSGETLPTGYASIEALYWYKAGSNTRLSEAPSDVGEYEVYVKYTPADAVNYQTKYRKEAFEITPCKLTADVRFDTSKVYDTGTGVTLTCTPTNAVEGDSILLTAMAVYDSPDVGTGKTITVTFQLSGNDKKNYSVPDSYTITTGEITPRTVTVYPERFSARFWDGTDMIPLTKAGWTMTGQYTSDGLTLDLSKASAKVETSDAGQNKPVIFENVIVNGNDKGNYKIEIEPRTITIQKLNLGSSSVTVTFTGDTPVYTGNTVYPENAVVTVEIRNQGTITLDNSLWEFTPDTGLNNSRAGKAYACISATGASANVIGKTYIQYTIAKASYDMSGAKWNYTEAYDYDGTEKSVEVIGLPDGVTVGRYEDNKKTVVGDYTAKVTFQYDSVNYNAPVLADCNWSIKNDWTPTEYTVSQPNSNGWLNADLVITAKDGYELSLTNTADGVWSETLIGAVEGADSSVTFYVRNKDDRTISLAKTENYKLDKNTEATTTTGKVEFVERNSWQEFVNAITFNLFFKDEVTVKAEATDALSEVASIEYAVSNTALTLDEVKAITEWTAMPENGVAVTLEDTKLFVYFVRITDKAGNVTYLSTDGAEYDTTLPAISGIENGETYYTTQVVTVEDKNLASVELGGETVTLDNGTLTLAGNVDATYTIKVTDKAGNIIEYTVTMKTIAELTKSLDDITVGDVTSDDKEIIEQVIGDIDEQLANDELTEDEKAALEETKDKAQDLLDKIDEAANADDTENTEKVKDITADNVTPEDKSDLEKAKKDLEKTLDDYSDNLTEDEKKAIEDEIDRIDKAIAIIEKVEAVEDKIGSLPEDITKNDEAAIKAADDAYNALSDYEKSLVDKDAKKALDDAKAALAELNKPADTTSPNTGDNSNLWLWVALLFISGGATITLTVYDRKKRAAQK